MGRHILSLQFLVLSFFLRGLLFLTSLASDHVKYRSFLGTFIIRHLHMLLSNLPLRLCGFATGLCQLEKSLSRQIPVRDTTLFKHEHLHSFSGYLCARKQYLGSHMKNDFFKYIREHFMFFIFTSSLDLFFLNILVIRWTNILIFAYFGYVLRKYFTRFFFLFVHLNTKDCVNVKIETAS